MPESPSSVLQSTPPQPPSTDWTSIQAGDEVAFRALFDALYGPLRRFARTFVDDVATAEDLVQEAFVRLWDRRASVAPGTPHQAYLYRSVRNLALNLRRDQKTRQRLLEESSVNECAVAPAALPGPDDHLDGEELAKVLATCLADLPPRQREALHLSRFEGLSHGDVAITMGCSPRTVNNHLVAALATLRRRLSESGGLTAALAWWLT